MRARYGSRGAGPWSPQSVLQVSGSVVAPAAAKDDTTDKDTTDGDKTGGGTGGGLARQTSSDATLSALSVNGAGVAGFSAARSAYQAGVASTVAVATVAATPTHSGAAAVVTPDDADSVAVGHQVSLSAGRNAVSVLVTAQDGTTTKTYTVSVNRGVAAEYGWTASEDFDGLIAANDWPQDVWSDGTTMWVLDLLDKRLYAYEMSDHTRDSSKDFDTLIAASNTQATGIWSDETTMWVTDSQDLKLYAYKVSDQTRDSSKDFDTLHMANGSIPQNVWSDGTTMWVLAKGQAKVYAYKMSNKTRDSSKDFDTLAGAGNEHPRGVWSDGTTMWVSDFNDRKIYAYKMSNKTRDSSKDFDTLAGAGNEHVAGVWSDGTTMWVADWFDNKVYSYNLPVYAVSASVSGTVLVIAFSQDLAPAAGLSNSDFAVKKTAGGTEAPAALTGSPAISANTVTLTLATALTAADSDVKVGYTVPTTGADNKLAAAGGNEVSGFDLAVNEAPVFASATATRPLAENAAAGTGIGAPVSAVDGDGDTLAYTLAGADAASFDIASASGQLQTKAGVAYGYEAKASYSVTVTAADPAGLTGTATVTITLTDEDEPPKAPSAPRVAPASGSTTGLTASWDAPPNEGRPAISGYDVRYRPTGAALWADGPQNQAATTATINGLVAGTTYEVQVRATNADGDSEWSESGTGTPDPDAGVVLRGVLAYWTHPDPETPRRTHPGAAGHWNALRVASCTGRFDFRIILDKTHRTADQWQLDITRTYIENDRITYQFVNTFPGHSHVEGTVRLAPTADPTRSHGLTIRIRGRWGTHWSNWTPPTGLYCHVR